MANVTKRGNTYRIRVSNGEDLNGKQIVESATFRPDPDKTDKQNQKALEQFIVDFERRVKSGKFLDGEKITLQDFWIRWYQEYAMIQLQPTTCEEYSFLYQVHIAPVLGNMRLATIQPVAINRLYTSMLQERKDGKEGGYAPATIKRVHALLSSVFATAVQWNILTENPCNRVKPPKQTKQINDIQYFTPEQAAAFLNELDQEYKDGIIQLQHLVFFHIALFCGLRRGEIIALQWSDIDFNNRSVSVTKSTAIVNNKRVTKPPKNITSNRLVSLPEHIIDLLREYQAYYSEYRASIGSQWAAGQQDEYIFITWNGDQMYPSTPYQVFKKVLHRYNQEHPDNQLPDIPLHGLRHTSATLLISQQVDVRTVSGRLGHAQTSTTMNIYSHALQSLDQAAADKLELLFIKS